MNQITLQDFLNNTESFVENAAENDDFVTIKTKYGNIVLISEAEWNYFVDLLRKSMK